MISAGLLEENKEQEKKELLIKVENYSTCELNASPARLHTPFSPFSPVSSVIDVGEPDLTGRRELIQATAQAFYDKSTTLADTHYWVITFYTLVLPYFIEKWGNGVPNVDKASEVGTIIDTTFLLLISSSQLLGPVTHRAHVNKIKGGLNLLNTIQLPLLSFLHGGAYALPSIVTAISTGGVISTLDTAYTRRLYKDKTFWLKDTLAQIKMLDQLSNALDAEIKEMKIAIDHSPGYLFERALKSKEKRLDECNEKQKKLEDQLITRVKNMRLNQEDLTFIKTHLERQKKKGNYYSADLEESIGVLEEDDSIVTNIKRDEEKIVAELKEKYKESGLETVFWLVGSTGMSLLMVPECDVYTIPIFAVAAGIKFYQTAPAIYGWAKSAIGFFKNCCHRMPTTLEINSREPILTPGSTSNSF